MQNLITIAQLALVRGIDVYPQQLEYWDNTNEMSNLDPNNKDNPAKKGTEKVSLLCLSIVTLWYTDKTTDWYVCYQNMLPQTSAIATIRDFREQIFISICSHVHLKEVSLSVWWSYVNAVMFQGPTNGAGGPQHFYSGGYPHYHVPTQHHMQHSPPPPVFPNERAQRQYVKLKQKLERKQNNRNNGIGKFQL